MLENKPIYLLEENLIFDLFFLNQKIKFLKAELS